MLHVVSSVKRKMVRVEVWFLAASVHSLVAKRKEKSVEEEAERGGRVWWQQEEEETQRQDTKEDGVREGDTGRQRHLLPTFILSRVL